METISFKGYKIEFKQQAIKDLKKIDKREADKISKKLKELVAGATNIDIKKLVTDSDKQYRLRCGDYRVIFEVERHIITVYVIGVAHRREAYRNY